MTDHDEAVLEVWIFFALIFFTILAAYWFYIRFIRDGDVVAEANQIRQDHAAIDSFVTEWMEPTKHSIHITEALYLAKQRSTPRKARR